MNEVEEELSKNMDLDATYVDEYRSAYREHVHTLLAWGYADSRSKILVKYDEPAITGFIAEAIQDRLDAPDSPSWCDQIAIKDDPPIPGGGRTGRRRWRPDLIFESVEKRPRPKYHFEAKRLRKQLNKSIEAYLGVEGLQCFLSGRYASESDEAGMLGYVQCDDVNTWMDRLRSMIDQDCQSKNELFLLSPQCTVQVVDAFPLEWVSKHKRSTGRGIIVHHILLDYCL